MNKKVWHKISDIEKHPHGNFLSFDIDWAEDFVLSYCIDIVEQYNIPATWFVTHDTPLLARLRANNNFELGIHPNFNNLLDGNKSKSSKEIVEELIATVPEAKSIRSHSLTQNSRLQELFVQSGLLYECNHYIPYYSEIALSAWRIWNGLIKVPHFWADDAALILKDYGDSKRLLQGSGLKVFCFHPIHVYLNSEDLIRYESSRLYHRTESSLAEFVNINYGTRNFLAEILE